MHPGGKQDSLCLFRNLSRVPARDEVQQTAFGYDVLGRYICNSWQEIAAAQGPGAYPFDVVVIGQGLFGTYCAKNSTGLVGASALRILVLDAGAFLLPLFWEAGRQHLRMLWWLIGQTMRWLTLGVPSAIVTRKTKSVLTTTDFISRTALFDARC